VSSDYLSVACCFSCGLSVLKMCIVPTLFIKVLLPALEKKLLLQHT